MRHILTVMTLAAALVAGTMGLSTPASAQNLFEPVIKVNDKAITRYELQQRERLLRLLRAPGDAAKLAREQLVEERLKLDAAEAEGIVVDEAAVESGMEEFAGRNDMSTEEFVEALEGSGVERETFRDFVHAGVTWRELVRARFGSRVSVSEEDIKRAKAATSGVTGVQVLVSEIILPAPPQQMAQAEQLAKRIARVETIEGFAEMAREHSAARSSVRGGRMDWLPITELPEQLRPIILGLAPGEVTDPLPLDGALALFQLRNIREVSAPEPDYAAIEYATLAIPGGRSEETLSTAAEIEAVTDTCDDLYGVARDMPEDALQRTSKAPGEIPQDIRLELAKLDAGEVSMNVTRNDGRTLLMLMLCGRSPELETDAEGPSEEELSFQIRNRRLESFANSYLERLRAEARIVRQ
ncbi:peptidylprolyl isomerase [Roseovarius salinarum]|uniref:peptidylprolyl isomerase n=1 Tax=Roseovarius salinarum TaxID=1981892 RepID=UPI001E5507CD|nr:peptidylprolyl isomerase [Roseovarius salinarum]